MRTNPTQSTSEELDLYRALQTLKDRDGNYILSTISFASQYGLQHLIEFIDARLQAYTDEIRREVIGDGEVHVSHVCPLNNIGCAKFAAREQMRHGQRQALNNIATKWGVK